MLCSGGVSTRSGLHRYRLSKLLERADAIPSPRKHISKSVCSDKLAAIVLEDFRLQDSRDLFTQLARDTRC